MNALVTVELDSTEHVHTICLFFQIQIHAHVHKCGTLYAIMRMTSVQIWPGKVPYFSLIHLYNILHPHVRLCVSACVRNFMLSISMFGFLVFAIRC